MRGGMPFWHIFTKLPRRAQLVMATAVVGIATNYVGKKTVRNMESANLSANMEKIQRRPPNWSCFYYAKQYREECSDYNRAFGGEYIEDICSNLECKMRECDRKLAREIEGCQPYAMDDSARIIGRPPWLNTVGSCNNA